MTIAARSAAMALSPANLARSLGWRRAGRAAQAVQMVRLMDYADVVERSAALVAAVDCADRVVLFNSRCEEACGIARDDARGRSWLELFVPTEDHQEVAGRFAAARSGETVPAFTAAVA